MAQCKEKYEEEEEEEYCSSSCLIFVFKLSVPEYILTFQTGSTEVVLP